jgi:four helix bundle protein
MSTFEKLEAFQGAVDLTVGIYEATATFPRTETYGLSSQLRRAATGVASNIAEGQGRLSRGEWRQFLSQARGSLFEVEAQLILAHRLVLLTEDHCRELQTIARHTGKLLAGLIRYVLREEQRSRENRSRQTAN